MTSKRIPTGLSGILAIDKPAGKTSHDVINVLRRLSGERRIGHAGTLDPLATGLLVVCVGPATRLSDYLMSGAKTYEARICFGTATDTDDSEGEVIRTGALPQELADPGFAAQALMGSIGEVSQVPPAYSAVKIGGVTSYKAARSGKSLELRPRRVRLHDATLLAVGKGYWDVCLKVSKGFYVRAFARDLGERVGSVAHLGSLRRTASGNVSLAQAAELSELKPGESLPFIDPVAALGFSMVEIGAADAKRVQNGRPLTVSTGQALPGQPLVSIVHAGRLLALYELAGSSGLAHPKVVIPGGVSAATDNRGRMLAEL